MKVQELIAELQKLPPELPIAYDTVMRGYQGVRQVMAVRATRLWPNTWHCETVEGKQIEDIVLIL